jgi:hypothetical protein
MELPPSLLGAVQPTNADFESACAVAPVGAPGADAPSGVTELDGADSGPEPAGFDACTMKVYEGPPLSPVTVVLVAGGEPVIVLGVWAVEPMYGVILYEATVPLDGAVHDTFAEEGPGVAVTPVTCPGGLAAYMTSTK